MHKHISAEDVKGEHQVRHLLCLKKGMVLPSSTGNRQLNKHPTGTYPNRKNQSLYLKASLLFDTLVVS